MKGHIRERSPGHWAIVLDLRDPGTGKRKRKWHAFTGTKRQAQTECSRLITEMSRGTYLEPAKETVAQFLDRWLEHTEPNVAPRTLERYQEIARKNLAPLLGHALLMRLRPEQISSAYAKALKTGRRDGTGGLSPRTVHHLHRILKQALSTAVRWNLIVSNPAEKVDPPKVERSKMRALDAGETAVLIAHFRGTRMFIPVLLAVLCGLRRGEIVALRWCSVDLARRQLSVAQSTEQTKSGTRLKETKSGRARTVALPSLVVDELRKHRARQGEELLKIGVRTTMRPISLRKRMAPRFSRTASRMNSSGCGRRPRCCQRSDSMICATPTRPTCSRMGFIRRSHRSGSVTRPSASRSTCTAMSCPACRRMRLQRLTPRSGPL
jgi:integrase